MHTEPSRISLASRAALRMLLITAGLMILCVPALAQTDEIQVYDAEVVDPGIVNVMVHNNFIAIGHKEPAFLGAIVPNHSDNGAVEWAFGVKPWFEQGLYLPVYSLYSNGRGASVNGFKIRELFVRPNSPEHKFAYGVNFEFSVNARYWEPRRISSEVRPIVVWHLARWDLIYNPIVDTDYTGGLRGLEFVPAGRIGYNINKNWALSGEEYADFGPLRDFLPAKQQFHEVWAVVNHAGKAVDVETGVGVGVTSGADKLTFKLMLSRNLNHRVKH